MTEFYYFALSFFVYGFLGWCTEVAYAAVKQGDIIEIQFGTRTVKVEVLDLQETTKKEEAKELFRYI